jgi:predicted nucleotidyltransferase
MQLTPEQRQSIINWAESLPKVTVVYLLGGRACGTAKPDSDIELGLALGSADSWRDLLTYLNHRRAWRLKLEKILGLRVHLELLNHERAADVPHPTTAREILWRRG